MAGGRVGTRSYTRENMKTGQGNTVPSTLERG
jgi:hypothetical protein